jgi:hypothetical protein
MICLLVLLVKMSYGKNVNPTGYIVGIFIFVALAVPAIGLLGQLFFFHLQLGKFQN